MAINIRRTAGKLTDYILTDELASHLSGVFDSNGVWTGKPIQSIPLDLYIDIVDRAVNSGALSHREGDYLIDAQETLLQINAN